MGRLFLVNLEGKAYSCKHCKTHLALVMILSPRAGASLGGLVLVGSLGSSSSSKMSSYAMQVHHGSLYVNGVEQQENFIAERPSYTSDLNYVPNGVYVLGDNPNNIYDSHNW
ncbi:hypothetical protein F3Y22_tig00110328pilonHSYRG00691 [Hibiscus syriacus]|uniref:Peptidase S26 domain-containing protein n=1 Tax=Hibiscus syriacus TaxID=106335 RepID=A0A6A3B3E6_HIBSY|nr:hypothetical protein F3Y22_tig00110328pilonHSYRG00691 [Hibiscus syriacus]